MKTDADDYARDDNGQFATTNGDGGSGGGAPSAEQVAELRARVVASGKEKDLAAYIEAQDKYEAHHREKLEKASALRAKGVDIGKEPHDIEASEKAFATTLGGQELDDTSVRSLLGVPESVQVKARVEAKPPDGVSITSMLSDAGGNHLAQLNRTYTRDADGLTVHHDLLVLDEAQKGKGVGGAIIRNQLDQYEKLGVSKVELLAAWDGRYVWPKMGFEVEDHEKPLLKRRWASYEKRNGLAPSRISGVQDIVKHPNGKAFLLGARAPMLSLSATPAQLKARLNEKRKT